MREQVKSGTERPAVNPLDRPPVKPVRRPVPSDFIRREEDPAKDPFRKLRF